MDKETREKITGNIEEAPIENGGHVIFSCSTCEQELIDVWVTKPEADVTFKITANCWSCGDKSFSQIIKGGFHLGVTKETDIVSCESMESEPNVLLGIADVSYVINTKKSGPRKRNEYS